MEREPELLCGYREALLEEALEVPDHWKIGIAESDGVAVLGPFGPIEHAAGPVQAIAGVNPGEQVVTIGHDQLVNGDKVMVVDTGSTTVADASNPPG